MDYYNLEVSRAFLISLKAIITLNGATLILRIADTSDQWELPGGLLEMDEPLTDGLIREVLEETGLAVSVGKIVAAWDAQVDPFTFRDSRMLNVRVILIAYLCTTSEETVKISDEHDAFRWVPNDELIHISFAANSSKAIQAYLLQVEST